jgi:hypothetical protein
VKGAPLIFIFILTHDIFTHDILIHVINLESIAVPHLQAHTCLRLEYRLPTFNHCPELFVEPSGHSAHPTTHTNTPNKNRHHVSRSEHGQVQVGDVRVGLSQRLVLAPDRTRTSSHFHTTARRQQAAARLIKHHRSPNDGPQQQQQQSRSRDHDPHDLRS